MIDLISTWGVNEWGLITSILLGASLGGGGVLLIARRSQPHPGHPDWTCDVDVPSRDYRDLPTHGLPQPLRFEPPPAVPVQSRPIPANLPPSRGGGLVWSSVRDQIEAYDDARADPPPPYDRRDTLGRTA